MLHKKLVPKHKEQETIVKPKRKVRVTRQADVDKFLAKMRERSRNVDRIIEKYITRYHIKGTNNEQYWRLKGWMVINGKDHT